MKILNFPQTLFACLTWMLAINIVLVCPMIHILAIPCGLAIAAYIVHVYLKVFDATPRKQSIRIFMLAAILSSGGIYFWPDIFIKMPQRAANRVVLKIPQKQEYINELGAKGKAPPVMVFDAGGGFLSPRDILYDSKEEILLPPQRRSWQWWQIIGRSSEYGSCGIIPIPLGDHFFFIQFYC